MKVCVLPSLLVCGLQATHLLRLFGSTRGSFFTVNNYFGPNSGNTNNNGQSGQAGYNNGQTDSGGNNVVTRQVILNKVKLVSF